MSHRALNTEQFAGSQLYHPVTTDVVRAIQRGAVTHLSGLRGVSRILGETGAIDQPFERGDLAHGAGFAVSRIRPGARLAMRGEGEEPGDEDISVRHAPWRAEGTHEFDIHHPRAVSHFLSAGRDVGQEFARARGAPRLRSYSADEFYHHTSSSAGRDIISRLQHGEPGMLMSRHGDTGPGIYTSADPTAWGKIGGGEGYRFDVALHGHRGLGAGPGGSTSMYDPEPPKIVSRKYYSGHERTRVDPNFWREHGYDTVVTGGKETVATHPLQVQVLRAHEKSTGRVQEFNDSVHRHYHGGLRVRESDYSPRQESN
jgi:hypothetical protein